MSPLGSTAPDFSLRDTDGRLVTLQDFEDAPALLVMFICNHCPYVKHIREELARFGREYVARGLGIVAISSNDPDAYPDDSPDAMKVEKETYGYPFPYLFDESQDVARAYDAVCTPDFFGYNAELELQYRGRLDDGRTGDPSPGAPNELLDAMVRVAEMGKGPEKQIPSIGCSIKWK